MELPSGMPTWAWEAILPFLRGYMPTAQRQQQLGYNPDVTPEERYARIDARLKAIAMHLELAASLAHAGEANVDNRLDKLLAAVEKDAENIRALARIAEGGGRKN